MKKNGALLNHFVFKNDKNIQISKDDYIFDTKNSKRQDVIDNLKKFNVFVGANNSGKSRILRALFDQEELMDLSLTTEFLAFFSELNTLLDESRIARGQLRTTDILTKEMKRIDEKTFLVFNNDLLRKIDESISEMNNKIEDSGVFLANGEQAFPLKLQQLLLKYKPLFLNLKTPAQRHRLYIPTLRGLRPLGVEDLYHNRTKKDYFPDYKLNKVKKIFTGFSIYEDLANKIAGMQIDRSFVKKYEKFLSEKFFNNSEISLVPIKNEINSESNDVVYITFDNKENNERPIYKLGDGLQTIISITYPLFEWAHKNSQEDNTFLLACIEEPEIYLHPSMQRKLVEVLMDKNFDKVQYFITTHSNHFLDLINDYEYQNKISLYSVNLIDGTKHVRQENDLSDTIYDLLGTRPSSILLANKTIWVEGISDRMYIRHGLNLYLKSNNEEKRLSEYYDYAFVEYSGSNLDHYFKDDDEQTDLKISSLSNLSNVFLLADDDGIYLKNKKGGKFDRYEQAKKELGKKFKTTDGIEIENYLTPNVLKLIYSDNKKIQNLTSSIEYKKKSLPEFLNKKYEVKKYINTIEKTPRFVNKRDFAKKAIDEQKTWDDLSKEMQELIKLIITFIKE